MGQWLYSPAPNKLKTNKLSVQFLYFYKIANMPEDTKKNQHKSKHDPKDQRRPRQARQQAAAEKKPDKKQEEPKVPPPSKPVYEEPGPEFYKNLKRETEEILKITEEANSKYKKKEIQSNWSKYEMPIESYEEIEEQENMGADYEKLIETPQSIGGHFQFKHEKSWDISTGPSLYDRYFDINMDNLAVALSTIPFYERNSIEQSIFSPTDILTMDSRSTRYKRKYYNDKLFSTPELEAQDKILDKFKDSLSNTEGNKENLYKEDSDDLKESIETKESVSESKDIVFDESRSNTQDVPSFENKNEGNRVSDETVTMSKQPEKIIGCRNLESKKEDSIFIESNKSDNTVDDNDDKILENIASNVVPPLETKEVTAEKEKVEFTLEKVTTAPEKLSNVADSPAQQSKSPVIASPEDLEKWLDDFLDG